MARYCVVEYDEYEEEEESTASRVIGALGTALTVAWWVALAVLPGIVLAWFFR